MRKNLFVTICLLIASIGCVQSQNWLTTGNLGTTSSDYVGTKDARPLRFKVNSIPAGYIGADGVNDANVAFGFRSSYTFQAFPADTIKGNTSIGAQAYEWGRGINNTAVGNFALMGTRYGKENVAIGSSTLATVCDTCSYNVAVGHAALCNNKVNGNVAIGYKAGVDNTIGKGIVAIGFNALRTNTTGEYNTSIGFQSLKLNTTGYWNVAVGSGSLQNNTTGFQSTAVGVSALHYNTTGEQNTAVGEESLGGNTTGSWNTAVGTRALWSAHDHATTDKGYGRGYGNVAVGYESVSRITTGSDNTGIGALAMRYITTGSDNVGVGKMHFITILPVMLM
jgi:hypothetical protein